ncbi:MAG: hypothetical protein WB557_09105 [Solirubrobacteraceae bacterium]
MTDLADGVVYSRSALTYQAGLLERRGLIIEVVSRMLLDPLTREDLETLTGLSPRCAITCG